MIILISFGLNDDLLGLTRLLTRILRSHLCNHIGLMVLVIIVLLVFPLFLAYFLKSRLLLVNLLHLLGCLGLLGLLWLLLGWALVEQIEELLSFCLRERAHLAFEVGVSP